MFKTIKHLKHLNMGSMTSKINKTTNLIISTDAGQDCDDELALLFLASVVKNPNNLYPVKICAIIANLYPADDRARLVTGMMNYLNVPTLVGTGTHGGDVDSKHHNNFVNCDYMSYNPVKESGEDVFLSVAKSAKDKSLTFLCISSLRDISIIQEKHKKLFKKKVKEVVIMGGAEITNDGKLVPDSAHNNTFDKDSSNKLFEALQEQNIPMVIFTRHAAAAAKMDPKLYNTMAETGNLVAKRLNNSQEFDLNLLWKRSCSDDPEIRSGLPGRCDRAWFSKQFCGGNVPDNLTGNDNVWPFVNGLTVSDVGAAIASIPYLRETLFSGLKIGNNLIIGSDEDNSGIPNPDNYLFILKSILLNGMK